MGKDLRQLLSFTCEGLALGGSLDEASGETGILLVTGGSQTRIGSHRMYERLAASLASAGYSAFRYDRRGVGDSEGEDPGYRESGPDLGAAAAAFRAECPTVRRMLALGLCDGATALALHQGAAGIAGIILINPWLVEAEANAPPPAAIKQHYRQQLMSLSGLKRLLGGSVSYRKLLKGLLRIVAPPPSDLAAQAAAALASTRAPSVLILARGDATAMAAEEVWKSPAYKPVRQACAGIHRLETDSHTFAKPGDDAALLAACLAAIKVLETSSRD